ncbi:MAG TPA: DUF58 domain-containing protein, partial [Actinomycetota bacterium]|nr:DUF58 domain-containing protein [Actinomycetota bacterium]
GRHDLHLRRTVSPPRASQNQPVGVSIELRNEGRGAAPLLLLEDKLPPGLSGNARFAVHGIEPAGQRKTGFVMKAVRRGRYDIGPLHIGFVDPFGLARIKWRALGVSSFLVHPRIERLSAPKDSGERRSLASTARRQPTGARGEDFYTMREYVEGDDLRKIHWPATAKRGEFMIRQEETPWHTRSTILLDNGVGGHGGIGESSTFERSVEAAASLCDLYLRSGYGWRLIPASGMGLPSSRGSDHFNRCLDALATIEAESADDALLVRLTELEAGGTVEAALVVVGGTMSPEVAMALTRCRRRFRAVTVVSFPAHRFGSEGTKDRWEHEGQSVEVARLLGRSSVRTLVLGPDESLAVAWSMWSQGRTEGGAWGQKPELV